MKTFLKLMLVISLVLSTSCASKYVVLPNENLNRFNSVIILIEPDVDQQLYNKLSLLFRQKGLSVSFASDFSNTLNKDLSTTIICGISGRIKTGDARIYLDCYDRYRNAIYHGEGSTIFAGVAEPLNLLEKAFQGFQQLYSVYKPELVKLHKQKQAVKYTDWEKIILSEKDIIEYCDKNIDSLDKIEGVWTELESNQYKIAIIKDNKSNKRDFVAFIIDSKSFNWSYQQVKIEFEKTAYSNIYTTTFYLDDHTQQGTTANITNEGLLRIPLQQLNKNFQEVLYIRNYPKFSEGTNSLDSPSLSSSNFGSGFLISESGLIVTNYHVVEGRNKIEVKFSELQNIYNAKIILKDRNNDIAILQIDKFDYNQNFSSKIPFSLISSKTIKIGEKVFTLGFPLGDLLGKNVKFSDGSINSIFGIKDDPRVYQISNPIQPGNSGGPLFNYNGDLVGIIVASLNAKFLYEKIDIIPQNVNFAIKIDYLINLLSMLPEGESIINRKSNNYKKNTVNMVRNLTPYIVQIHAM